MKKYRFLSGKKPAQAMVEFAIALPILLLLLYGILEAGRLLFMYSTVVTASRQAARYGVTTGVGVGGVPRYQDCKGIRDAATAVMYLGTYDSIALKYDTGPGTTQTPYCPTNQDSDSNLTTLKLQGNRTRLVVTVSKQFYPLVKLVPFFQRPITASSARTILYSVPIVVEQPQQEWYKNPTYTTITVSPNPAEILQPVLVTVQVTGDTPKPTGTVKIEGADTNCTVTLNSNGSGSCSVIFNTAGDPKVLTATYEGDENNLGSSQTANVTITLMNSFTTIISDLPDASIKDQPFVVVVQVTGGSTTPTGTVDIDGGGGVTCTIPLSNGVGNCTLSYNNSGSKLINASYNGDAMHLPSVDPNGEPHQVIDGTPTPTLSPIPPTATTVPPPTPTFTPSPTATLIPTAVPACDKVTKGPITTSGNTMSMTVTNPYPFTIMMQDVTVTWNYDKGHQTGNDKTLRLQNVVVGGVSVWTGDVGNVSYKTIPTTATLPPGTTTVTFYFHQSYDNLNNQEKIFINLLTPGCEGNPIDSSK